MARAIWTGHIGFGLVEIPVELQSAEISTDLKFSFLDGRDLGPVGYKRINKNTGEEVPWDEIVRGYEYEKGEFVVLTDEDFQRANVEASQTVEILHFVDPEEIDPMYFDRPYYLQPVMTKKSRGKAYALLRETLRRTDKVAIARVVIRTRQHLAVLSVRESVLVLNLLRYHHELREPSDIEVPAEDLGELGVTRQELEAAEQLVEGLVQEWDPSRYRDEYRDDLMTLIDDRVSSGTTAAVHHEEPKAPRKRGEVLNLMPLLKKSLEQPERELRGAPRKRAVRGSTRASRKTTRRKARRTA